MARTSSLAIAVVTLLSMISPAALLAADIEGTIVIKHRLTKKRVTAPVSAYQRGVTVELASGPVRDDLAFERGRVAVYLEGEYPSTPVTATLEQQNRNFVTDTLVIPAGSTVSFPNRDAIFHNVFSLSKPKTFDLGNYPKDHSRSVEFDKPGIVFVNCHLHPNMAAAIVVSPNSWATKADGAGRFVLRDVFPGTYTIVAWHRVAGFFRQRVQVFNDHASPVEFFIPLDEAGNPKVLAQR
jgi:plastocyanin